MRESNFAFPAQNKACVCITSQLYDRRALDTTAPLPLLNSLTHLMYLTSTSPRIREIMTMDGGLERLVRILLEYCICPTPPENPAVIYGLLPPNARPPKLSPVLIPHQFDKHAAYRFSLAFQCVVNIGVRGSEPIRSRVVQAGTLDVVGCVLEAWLANKGFAVGPSSSATGLPRESREQRQARRTAQLEQRQREEAAQLSRALQRQVLDQQRTQREIPRHNVRFRRRADQNDEDDDSMDVSPVAETSNQTTSIFELRRTPSMQNPSQSNSDTELSTDNSIASTPIGTGTPTGSVVIPSRDRSGTVIARPTWDPIPVTNTASTNTVTPGSRFRTTRPRETPSPPTDTSRPDTETEDDGDGDGDGDTDMDRSVRLDDMSVASESPSPDPRPRRHPRLSLGRRAVGIVTDDPQNGTQTLQVGNIGNMGLDTDAHIIINEGGGAGEGGMGVEVGVDDGIVSLEPNDDFAMGAPPGAPGAMIEGTTPRGLALNMDIPRRRNTTDAPDVTPRAGVIGLPMMPGGTTGTLLGPGVRQQAPTLGNQRNTTIRNQMSPNPATGGANNNATTTPASSARASSSNHRDADSGPYRDEDVLFGLQLLAYLSKYPHVRQAFYKPRVTFHPASVNHAGGRYTTTAGSREKDRLRERVIPSSSAGAKDSSGFFRSFAGGNARGKEKERTTINSLHPNSSGSIPSAMRQTNVFSLVERFTFKPSSTETDLPNPPPRLPSEIQYWAGVIMRNACRKDDSRGGIRQCANMLCGRWESYPREFAKCRRCRKAKYCGKECQSTAWSEGHRFWCSAKDAEEDNAENPTQPQPQPQQPSQPHDGIRIMVDPSANTEANVPVAAAAGAAATPQGTHRTDRRVRERERERPRERDRVVDEDATTVRGFRPGQPPAGMTFLTEGNPHTTPPRDRTTPARVRPRLNNVATVAPIDPYLTFGHDAGRRRPETAPVSVSSPGRSRPEIAPNVIPLPPHQGPTYLPAQQQHQWFIVSPTQREEAGPSRRNRIDIGAPSPVYRSPTSDDQDMVLG